MTTPIRAGYFIKFGLLHLLDWTADAFALVTRFGYLSDARSLPFDPAEAYTACRDAGSNSHLKNSAAIFWSDGKIYIELCFVLSTDNNCNRHSALHNKSAIILYQISKLAFNLIVLHHLIISLILYTEIVVNFSRYGKYFWSYSFLPNSYGILLNVLIARKVWVLNKEHIKD